MNREPSETRDGTGAGEDGEVPATDPAHRVALVLMVAAPLALGAAVYWILKLLAG